MPKSRKYKKKGKGPLLLSVSSIHVWVDIPTEIVAWGVRKPVEVYLLPLRVADYIELLEELNDPKDIVRLSNTKTSQDFQDEIE